MTEAYKNEQVINESHIISPPLSHPVYNSSTMAYRLSLHSLASIRVSKKQGQSSIRFYSQSRGASRLSKALQPRPGTISETYFAYGITRRLFEACSRQADYSIPQASQKGAEVPKTSAGEDLGVGDSWWYKGPYNARFVLP